MTDDTKFDPETGEIFEEEEEELPETEIPEIQPSETQSKAITDIIDWYENRTDEQQVYRLFGYAGTGKTTITKYAIAELGLSMFAPPKRGNGGLIPDVFFGAFTGKASMVMRKHGTPASTIHSMIMRAFEATDQEIERAEQRLLQMIADVDNKSGLERSLAIAVAEAFRRDVEKMKQPGWHVDIDADVAQSKLIVLDEVSMVDPELAGFVLSFGKPVLVIGDPGQLPPIKGEGAFTVDQPDMMLEEIHRQALDSPIIRLATMARNGEYIPLGEYGPTVAKLAKSQIGIKQLLRADQVICGLNATRYQLNSAMRNFLGFNQYGPLPSGKQLPDIRGNMAGERLICLKNNHSVGLVNGMNIEITEPKTMDYELFDAIITTEEGTRIARTPIYSGFFRNHYEFDKDRESRDWKARRRSVESTYAWAITCHKAQGSQYRNVLVYDDRWGRGSEQRAKWLYTAITRAEDGLVIVE